MKKFEFSTLEKKILRQALEEAEKPHVQIIKTNNPDSDIEKSKGIKKIRKIQEQLDFMTCFFQPKQVVYLSNCVRNYIIRPDDEERLEIKSMSKLEWSNLSKEQKEKINFLDQPVKLYNRLRSKDPIYLLEESASR